MVIQQILDEIIEEAVKVAKPYSYPSSDIRLKFFFSSNIILVKRFREHDERYPLVPKEVKRSRIAVKPPKKENTRAAQPRYVHIGIA